MAKKDNSYNVDKILHLDQITHVRHRIGVYLGGVDSVAATTGLREFADNSFDEGLAGHGDTVIVRLFEDGSAEVEDYGRGLPVDSNKDGLNGIILTIGTVGSGGKFSGETISGGLNGMGASAANAAASRLDVTVNRDGKTHKLSFKEGRPGHFAKENDPNSTFTPSLELKISKDTRSAAERKAHPTGTKIRFWLDHTVFMPDAVFLAEDIKARLKATCFLLPHMTAIVEDFRDPAKPVIDKYHFNSGIEAMIPTLASSPMVTSVIRLEAETSFEELTNIVQKDGSLKQGDVTRVVNISTAFGYTGSEDTKINSYVNLIQTKNGGTHESGLWRALSRTIINHIKAGKEAKYLKAKEESPVLEDVKDGFVGAIAITFPEPTFDGQAKSELRTPQMTALVSQAVGAELKKWLETPKNKNEVKKLCTRVVEASRIRIAAKQQKDVARKKSAMETAASMPSKLVDCAEHGPGAELLLVEGDSALGTIRAARDSSKQAIFPLRGKVLNVQKSTLAQMLNNAECSGIIQILGAGSGRSFELDQARYENVILNADADVDGNHITVLLITFFYKYMKPLVEAGRLYVSTPPLYVIKTKGKKSEIIYASDDAEKDKILTNLDRKGIKYEPLVRLKGLGEMDADEFWDTTLNPATRTLRRVTVPDAELAEAMLELAMGSKVEPRRDWIVDEREKIADEMLLE